MTSATFCWLLAVVFSLFADTSAQSSQMPTISAVGAKFFFSNGTQYYIKGVAYQLTPDDPLLDVNQCTRDAKLMADLGANTIRVYHVDPTQNHDQCMKAFADQGIYLFLDLDTFTTQFDQDNPGWNQTQLTAFEQVLDAFQGYANLAGVFVANEAMTRLNGSDAAPYVKAAIRDVKSYRNSKKYRSIPVGYSGADIPDLRPMLQNYLACGNDPSQAADFFSLNVYEWCGSNTFSGSGYDQLVANATGLQIPIFISETGCHVPEPRLFQDQDSIFGKDMSSTWSGAIIYEWIEESNNYGLVSYGPTTNADNPTALDGYPRSGTPTPISPDYSNLKAHWATLHPTGVALTAYSAQAASLKPIACPSSTPNGWIVNAAATLPSLGQTLGKTTATATGKDANAPGGTASASSTKKGAAAALGAARPGIWGTGTGDAVLGVTGVWLVGMVFGLLAYL